MARRKEAGHGGGHGWFVTFADLMGLCQFLRDADCVLDTGSGQAAGRRGFDARCVRRSGPRYSALSKCLACRHGRSSRMPRISIHLKRPPTLSTPGGGPSAFMGARSKRTASSRWRLRRCGKRYRKCRNHRGLKHIMLEETKQGLNIEIVDQDGRSMFPEGRKEP